MLVTFLALLCGGIMLAVAISDHRAVTLHWLRLAGILALVFGGVSLFLILSHGLDHANRSWQPVYLTLFGCAILSAIAQLGFAQLGWRTTQRVMAACAAMSSIAAATMLFYGQGLRLHNGLLAFAGVAGMCGLALMDMLLGHAYLTASKMSLSPFRRMNLALSIALVARVGMNVAAIVMERAKPIEMFWARDGLYVGMRWFVGLIVPAVFIYMAHDCIKRRATQSATGILYVAGVLIFIGEIVAMQLIRETGLPF